MSGTGKISAPTWWRSSKRAALAALAYALLLQLTLSPDSYLHDIIYLHLDCTWFYTCGKAWMCGMTPYVDFADSKGPLLWLIYGIAYLINNHSFVGVFWISLPFYALSLLAAYKTARLYLPRLSAALAVALLPHFLYLLRYSYETLAETFCLPFIFIAIYSACAAAKRKPTAADAAATGAALAACLLIKWDVAAMMLAPAALTIHRAARRHAATKTLTGLLAGFCAVVVPFLLYFALSGNLSDLISEYFVNTLATVTDGHKISLSRTILNFVLGEKIFLLLLAGTALFCWLTRSGPGMAAALCWFKLCCSPFDMHGRYMLALMPFATFLIIALLHALMARHQPPRAIIQACCIAAAASVVAVNWPLRYCGFEGQTKELSMSFYRAAYIMAQVQSPKILSYSHDSPVGVATGALPACRYWALQNGATQAMIDERSRAIAAGLPDFIIIAEGTAPATEPPGYVTYCRFVGETEDETLLLLGKPGLKQPPADFNVSRADILLKRNIFNIK